MALIHGQSSLIPGNLACQNLLPSPLSSSSSHLVQTRFFPIVSSLYKERSPSLHSLTTSAQLSKLSSSNSPTTQKIHSCFQILQHHFVQGGVSCELKEQGKEMESVDGNGGSRLVVTELSHIKELVMQLEVHLGGSPDLCKHMASQIFSITERSIGIITSSNLDGGRKRCAATPSPLSGVSDVSFKSTKKRKTTEKRKHQVRVSSAAGGENLVDDGHNWRKYGQKEILGAEHPRGYYRCTHRHSQGCTATKQVQRTDEDPTFFDVIYHGEHTCLQRAAAAGQSAATTQPPERNTGAHSLLQSMSESLTVKIEGLAVPAEPQGWSATATPFSGPETPENCGASPATSDSNHAACFAPFEAATGDDDWRTESELQELVSALVEAATSAPEPPVEIDFADEFFNLDQSILSYFASPYAANEQYGMESSHNVTRDSRTEEGSSPSWVSAGVNLRR